MKKFLFILLFCTLLLESSDDTLNLLDDLQEVSDISTKTKLNINKTPSIISVLHSSELQQLGIKSVYEALATVPGIQVSIGNAGAKKINMRGNQSLLKDKLKFLIDGTNVNNELTGGGYYLFLDMPIEMVERIEVIRGPAATMYGSQSHVGVINIITKSSLENKNVYFVQRSSKGKEDVGLVQSIDLGDVQIAIDGYFKTNENSRDTGPYVYNGGSINQATSYEDYENHSLGTIITVYEDLLFKFRFTEHETQNYYGYGDWPIIQDPRSLQTTSNYGEVQYTPTLSRDLSLDLRAGYREFIFEGQSRIKPLATVLGGPFTNDLIGDGYIREGMTYADAAVKYNIDKHNLLFGVYASETQQILMDYYFNNPTISSDPTILNPGIDKDISRYQYALYFNDIYNISDKFSANFGLRYDNYNDVESNVAHKLAFVYNKNEQESYKLMYQRSFRAPSWLELYGKSLPFIGDSTLKPEVIDTIELAYSHQSRLDSYFNINIFYTEMQNYINGRNYYFVNDQDIKSYGGEVEFKVPLSVTTALQTNYSYVHMQDANGRDVSLVANHLANVMLINTLDSHWSTGSHLSYIGVKKHDVRDIRADVPAYVTFDQALTYKANGFSVQLSVKNLFNQEIIDPSPLGNNELMSFANYARPKGTYINDYRRDGRTFWISAQWKFE